MITKQSKKTQSIVNPKQLLNGGSMTKFLANSASQGTLGSRGSPAGSSSSNLSLFAQFAKNLEMVEKECREQGKAKTFVEKRKANIFSYSDGCQHTETIEFKIPTGAFEEIRKVLQAKGCSSPQRG